MPSATSILRARNLREIRRRPLRGLALVGALLVGGLAIAGGGSGWTVAASIDRLTSDLPPIENIELAFGTPGEERFPAPVLTDRSGRFLLAFSQESSDDGGQWLVLGNAENESFMPSSVAHAAVAALDPSFWSNPGYEPSAIVQSAAAFLSGRDLLLSRGITERLTEIALLPLETSVRSPMAEWMRRAFQSARLTERYSKEQILEWFLNSADFGRSAFGIDAAAHVYLGKAAYDLTLAESAFLVGLLLRTDAEAALDGETASEGKNRVLGAMQEQGLIRPEERARAVGERVTWIEPASGPAGLAAEFTDAVRRELRARFGEAAASRPGLRIRTTLDLDLQLQAECTLRSHIARMQGGDPDQAIPAQDGSSCVVAGLLSPLRPGDTSTDHRIQDGAVVILDPIHGEILAFVGPASAARPAQAPFQPLLYVTAFSRGYAPATMVLDVPRSGINADGGSTYQGPVRMRTALANGLSGAAEHTLALLDIDQVFQVARQMGLHGLQAHASDAPPEADLEHVQASLLDMAFAYGVIAQQGRMTGVEVGTPMDSTGGPDLIPTGILEVTDQAGGFYTAQPEVRSVLSPALSYLIVNVLTDESARLADPSGSGLLAVGRVAGASDGGAGGGELRWTVGFASPRVVGVWISSPEGQGLANIDTYNGSAPVWRALLQYATRDLPPEAMTRPSGVSELEVCDPSGLLPTPYCPRIVREVFIQGTEPIHYDTLFQPFRVNRETGKLATLFTPLGLVDDRVYMAPPPGAEEWARQVGLPRPPSEYDTMPETPPIDPEANLTAPHAFAVLHGTVAIRGTAHPPSLDFYRLQYGEGLNPTQWVGLSDEVHLSVQDGSLGTWDTQGLNGLFTLQLIVVDQEGRVRTSALPLIVDNQPPEVRLVLPLEGDQIDLSSAQQVVIEVEASDSVLLDRVEFFLDGRRVGQAAAVPYSLRLSAVGLGEHTVYARAVDGVGNLAQTSPVTFTIVP